MKGNEGRAGAGEFAHGDRTTSAGHTMLDECWQSWSCGCHLKASLMELARVASRKGSRYPFCVESVLLLAPLPL